MEDDFDNSNGENDDTLCEETFIYKPKQKCNYGDCDVIASFNFSHIKRPMFCGEHKLNKMINVKHKTCLECPKRANFNISSQTTPLYCKDCKKEDMIDVSHKKCIGCNIKRPTFNISSETTALYCNDCKKEDMVDVLNKKCFECKNTRPNFNYPSETIGLYCKNCKKETDKLYSINPIQDLRIKKEFQYCYRCSYRLKKGWGA